MTNRPQTTLDSTLTTQLTQALARQDAWLQTMRQPGGYGGPVAHYWQHRLRYAGPGLDWRYEGILGGYARLASIAPATQAARWRLRIEAAAADLIARQRPDGHYPASSFEVNPRPLGTPHEAAASLGLLRALPHLEDAATALATARRNLDALIAALADPNGTGFNDLPGVPGRVPNKLATFAWALLELAEAVAATDAAAAERYRAHARAALADVLALQVTDGPQRGAVHQYAADTRSGDGRFFPYYNARCVPPLVEAAHRLGEDSYLEAARGVLGFLKRTMAADGGWPQIVYASGRRTTYPRWLAGAGDILLAFTALGEPPPTVALERLLAAQLPSGGFPTAEGFGAQLDQRPPRGLPTVHDLLPVVGWNDKLFLLLCTLMPAGQSLPEARCDEVGVAVQVGRQIAHLGETVGEMTVVGGDGAVWYHWRKREPWAAVTAPALDVR